MALQSLPLVKLDTVFQMEDQGDDALARVRVTNPSDHIAFFVQLAITGSSDQEILPVFWEDDYFSLLPSESRELTARIPRWAIGRTTPKLEIGGWNILSDLICEKLEVVSPRARAGESFPVKATVTQTFVDGSRVPLQVDGRMAASQWCWSRHKSTTLNFSVRVEEPGRHTLQVGNQSLVVNVE